MPNSYHQDLYDLGLAQISTPANWQGGTLTLCVCKGAPTTRAEAATAFPTGKRVTAEVALAGADLTLANRAGGGREITTAQKTGVNVIATTVAGDDLHYAIYDGSRARRSRSTGGRASCGRSSGASTASA